MSPTKQGRFVVRFTPHRCHRCETYIPRGEQAYRVKSRVYCIPCSDAENRDSPGPDDPMPKWRKASRKARCRKAPDPSAGGGAMPGKNAAARCADGVWRHETASIDEAVRDALDDYAQNDQNRSFLRRRLGEALSGSDRWANNFTKDRLLAELREPSQHLLDAVDAMRERLIGQVSAPSSPRRRVRRGQEFGEELDADRVLARSLAPWDRNVREQQARRTVTIGCNLSIHAAGKPEQLMHRGAAALALADILTGRGVNVGIVVFNSRTDPTEQVGRAVEKVVVKDPLMPLDVSAVAFAMCEIAFFRVVSAIGGCRHFPGKVNDGLGCVANLPAADREGLDYVIDADALSEDAAVEWLQGHLASQESEVCHV